MARILIIGYGNPLRGDDGLGWHVAGSLRLLLEEPRIKVLACHQLTPELAESISKADMAIFVDAASCGEPGSLMCQEVHPQEPASSAFTHHGTPPALLFSAERLYGSAPEAWLFSVPGESFDLAETLSPAVAAAVPRVVEAVCRMVKSSLPRRPTSLPRVSPNLNLRQ
jgi:hydrogenase maturation protease